MPYINFDRLPRLIRPQRRNLRPLQFFQLILLCLIGIFVIAKFIFETVYLNYVMARRYPFLAAHRHIDFFAPFLLVIIVLCIREVYKGSQGQKWHFHGICALTLLFALIHGWYYGHFRHEPRLSAIWAGMMVEFFAYIALNKILSVMEERRFETLVEEDNPSSEKQQQQQKSQENPNSTSEENVKIV